MPFEHGPLKIIIQIVTCVTVQDSMVSIITFGQHLEIAATVMFELAPNFTNFT